MLYATINPQQALERLQADAKTIYVDVRSEPEFLAGHPVGAVNVPIAHLQGGGMAANPDFLKVMSARFDKGAKLLVGCKMGGRSARACEVLTGAGFTDVANVDGGFAGRGDASDPIVRQGWSGAGLPVSREPKTGATWAEMRGEKRDG